MPDQGQADVAAQVQHVLTAQAVQPLADAALTMPASTAGLPASREADTLRTDSFAAFTSQQPLVGQQASGDGLRLSSFGGFAAGSVSTLSTGGALANLATAVLAQDGGHAKTVQQLKHLRHMHSQQGDQRSPRGNSPSAASTAPVDVPPPPHTLKRRSDSMLSPRSAGSDVSGRSDVDPASSSPLVRPKAIRANARQSSASAPHASSSLPGQWQPSAPSSHAASSAATTRSAGPPPPLRSATSAPDQLQLSPRGLPSERSSPREQSLTGGVAQGGGGGSCNGAPVDRKATASAPIIARSSSVSSGEVRPAARFTALRSAKFHERAMGDHAATLLRGIVQHWRGK